MEITPIRNLGSVYTPKEFAQFLASWAITTQSETVLDIGTGEGAFAFAAYRRLTQLGANQLAAQAQIYGAEIDDTTFAAFTRHARAQNLKFPNIHHRNFFDISFPSVDAVIGNPPYVRRSHMDDVDHVRRQVLNVNSQICQADLSKLTDLYIYFLLKALAHLHEGGKCAVITADSWLNARYGRVLKRYLQEHFHIDCLITLDRRIFDDAEVKPVMMLATKLPSQSNVNNSRPLYFIRIKNGLSVSLIEQSIQTKTLDLSDVKHHVVDQSSLLTDFPWSAYFKSPELLEELSKHELMTAMSSVASTRIGIQTLAKDFFVLTRQRAEALGIERQFLAPIAQSPSLFGRRVIEPGDEAEYVVFCCSMNKTELRGTKALDYIEWAETQQVQIRGKSESVTGYQNKERIKRSHRKFWYDLRTHIDRRGCASILIPRLVYKSYTVVWNKARYIPGELFIEFLPLPINRAADEVYLAVLTSTVTEVMLRMHAQIYGGGTHNINPGTVKKIPVLNVDRLNDGDKEALKQAYLGFLADPNHDRTAVDAEYFRILGLSASQQLSLRQALSELLVIATSIKKASLTVLEEPTHSQLFAG